MKAFVRRWALPAIALFVLFLVLTLPVRHALGWLDTGGLAVQSLEGTVWKGRAQRVVLGQAGVGPLVWQARALPLLAGRLEYNLYVQSGRGGGELRAGRGLLGGLYLADAQVSLPAAELARQLRLQWVALGGDFVGDIPELAISDGWITGLEGQVLWQRAAVLQPGRVPLGDLQMQLGLRDGRVVGTLSDLGGPLELSGEVLMGADRHYQLDARMKARDSAAPELQQALQLLGSPDAQGRYALQLSGTL